MILSLHRISTSSRIASVLNTKGEEVEGEREAQTTINQNLLNGAAERIRSLACSKVCRNNREKERDAEEQKSSSCMHHVCTKVVAHVCTKVVAPCAPVQIEVTSVLFDIFLTLDISESNSFGID